ncbi:putative axin interactor, dorsalization-associated protein-like [Diplonema papillatum]|nr:putative axin interactor, dorsalization-associated protein-like [Diplonema papillatum]
MALRESVGRWESMMSNALQYDQWGQVVEATDLYQTMRQEALHVLKTAELEQSQRVTLHKFQATLQLRLENLKFHASGQGNLRDTGPGIQQSSIAMIHDVRALLLDGAPWPAEIKIDSSTVEREASGNHEAEEEDMAPENKGRLFGPPKLELGQQALKIHIVNIGLKDALDYLDPFIAVSVRTGSTERHLVEAEQLTPHPKKRVPVGISFNTTVYILTPIGDIPPRANIFFEFKHYKPKKEKISTRCWSMLSPDEFTEGPKALEIYAKPTDFSAKKFHKHSNKPLFFNIVVSII